MAIKKRGRKRAAPPPPKRGRKKELKRFEMETWTNETVMSPDASSAVGANQVAFVVTTSGGSPLNKADTKKLFGLLQHEIRSLGHTLKRKGQPLDPKPKEPKPEAATADNDAAPPEDDAQTDSPTPVDTDQYPEVESTTNDPDNSDAHNEETSTT